MAVLCWPLGSYFHVDSKSCPAIYVLSPLTLVSSMVFLPPSPAFSGCCWLLLQSQESAGSQPPGRAACGGAGTTRQEREQGVEPGGGEWPEGLCALQLPGDRPHAAVHRLELACVSTASLHPGAQASSDESSLLGT